MFINALTDRVLSHLSSVALISIIVIMYIADSHHWIDSFLPENGKPLAIFILIAITALYELVVSMQKTITARMNDISHQMEVNRLVSAVNGLYGRFISSGDDRIENEYTIREIAELNDMRDRLGVNSYTQGRLEFLTSKIYLG